MSRWHRMVDSWHGVDLKSSKLDLERHLLRRWGISPNPYLVLDLAVLLNGEVL